jgi:hypothetical protein
MVIQPGSSWSKLLIALPRLNSQRPRRRDTTRRSKVGACAPRRNNSRLAKLTTTNSAMATKANRREGADLLDPRLGKAPPPFCIATAGCTPRTARLLQHDLGR